MIKKYLVPKNTLSLSLLGNSRLGNSRFGILKLAVAAVKTRLQDFFASHPLVASHPLGERFFVLKPQR